MQQCVVLFNHCCSGKSSKHYKLWLCVCSLSYPECNAHAPYGLSDSTLFFHTISQTVRFSKNSYWKLNVCF